MPCALAIQEHVKVLAKSVSGKFPLAGAPRPSQFTANPFLRDFPSGNVPRIGLD